MSRVTTIITGADGKVTRVVTRRSGCGCLPILAAVVVLFGPAAWFPLPLAVAAYALLGVLAVAAGARWFVTNVHRAAPQPPPDVAPTPDASL